MANAHQISNRLENIVVLLVDDVADIRLLLSTVLKRHGAKTIEVGSVAEAIQVLQQVKPDVIVSDIAMPDRDGYDLIRTVRRVLEAGAPRRTPAVAISGFTQEGFRRRSLREGFQAHLDKPINHTMLVDIVAHLAELDGVAVDHPEQALHRLLKLGPGHVTGHYEEHQPPSLR